MNRYRAYILSMTGHIVGVEVVNADDDRQAMTKAAMIEPDHVKEVWMQERKVARLEAELAR